MSLTKGVKNFISKGLKGLGITAGRKADTKKDTKKENKPTSYSKKRETVQIENRARDARLISDTINQNANTALKITHVGEKAPKPKTTAKQVGSKVFQGAMKALDTTGNASRTAYDHLQTGRNPLEGFKKGWTHQTKTTGVDIINNNRLMTKGIDTAVNALTKDKSKVEKRKNTVKEVAGFGLELGIDPLNYVTFGGKGFTKGLISGIGGTVGKETAEAGAKIAGKQLLRATAGKGLVTADDLVRAVANVPENKKAKVMQTLIKQVQAGGTVGQYSDEVATLASRSYDNLARQVAENSGFTMQKMLNAKSGAGVRVGKKQIVESGKMRDIGASINRRLLGEGTLRRRANDRLMELGRKGFKEGMKGDDYHLLRMVDSSTRGFKAKGFDTAMEKIAQISKGATEHDEAVVRRMLERGTDSVINVTPKQQQMYDTLKGLGSEIGNREVIAGMLNPAKLRENYLPRVKNPNLPLLKAPPAELNNLSEAKKIARQLNPTLGSSKSRIMNVDSVRGANINLREKYKELGNHAFFEESPTKAFALRAKDHFDKVGDKFKADDILGSVGQMLSVDDLKKLSAYEGGVSKILKRGGDTVLTQKSALSQIPLGNNVNLGDIIALSDSSGKKVSTLFKELGLRGDPSAVNILAHKVANSPDELITNLTRKDFQALASLAQTNLPKGAPIPVHALPREIIASLMDDVIPAKGKDLVSRDLLKGIDKFHNSWKPLKTSLNPNYYRTNLFGGVANTLADVGAKETVASLPSTAKLLMGQGDTAITAGGKRYTKNQLNNLMEATNVTSSSFAKADLKSVGRHIDDVTKGGGFFRHPIKSIQDMGSRATNATEQFIRTHEMVGNLRKGLDPISAGERVKMHQFDYGDLSNFEKNVMRRVMPFYTYKSKNIPTQLGKFLDNPLHHQRMLDKFPRMMANINDVDYDKYPEYAREQGVVTVGKNRLGMPRYFNPSLPQSDLFGSPVTGKGMDIASDAFGMITPLAKLPLETMFNMRLMPEGRVRVNNDDVNPAHFMGKTIPKKVENIIDTFNPIPDMKFSNPENLRGRVSQPDPRTLGFIKEFDEVANEKYNYYDRKNELDQIVKTLKKAGVELPAIDKIIGRKNSKKYNPAPKMPFLEGERFGNEPMNPQRKDFKTDKEYQQALKMAELYKKVPEKRPPNNTESWAEFITRLIQGGN